MQAEKNTLFPYLAPEAYLDELGRGAYVAWDFGQGLVIMLMSDIGSSVRSVGPPEIEALGLSNDDAWKVAGEKLNAVVERGEFEFKFCPLTSGAEAFLVVNHWLASAFSLHPLLFAYAQDALKSSDLRLLVPSRDNAFVVRGADFANDDGAMRELFAELQAMSRKPFPFNVFRLTDHGPQDD